MLFQSPVHLVVVMITVFGAMQQLVNNIRLIPHTSTVEHFLYYELFSVVSVYHYQNKIPKFCRINCVFTSGIQHIS